MMTLEQFKAARAVLQGVILDTGLTYSPALSKACGNQVFLKPENMQLTGAYKIRGAYYKISTLTDDAESKRAGHRLRRKPCPGGGLLPPRRPGVPATIVMPTTTPLVKVNNTKDYGAEVLLHGETFDDAAELASQLSREKGLTYVHPFNDLTLATGQGTIAYEIFQASP